MYYLHMRYEEIMTMELSELLWYYKKLKEVKDSEFEFEKIKLELNLAAAGVKNANKIFK